METEDMMEIEKKVYTAPELVEHGNLVGMTQGNPTGNPEAVEDGSIEGGIILP